MRTINKILSLFFCLSVSCRTHIDEKPVETKVSKSSVESLQNKDLYESHTDRSDYRLLDTVENGKKVTIKYDGSRIKSKSFKNEVWNYKDGKLINKIKDTIINSVKIFYKEEINGDETIVTVYEKNNPKKEYESIYRYKKGQLVSKIIVNNDKKGNLIENKTSFDENGKINLKSEREHRAYSYPKDNQNNEITQYYKSGKKYQWSKLVYIETKGDGNITRLEELNYYNLKNELIRVC
jgi:hypothetical protein